MLNSHIKNMSYTTDQADWLKTDKKIFILHPNVKKCYFKCRFFTFYKFNNLFPFSFF